MCLFVVSKHRCHPVRHDEPLGQIAAHPRLVHFSQGTYVKAETRPAKKPHREQRFPFPAANVRTFRSHLNLSLMIIAVTDGEDRKLGHAPPALRT